MKIPDLFHPRKKLHAATRALSKRPEEYDEPNMKLSSAFVVVFVLHVVAVGGIYAFNSIKAHQSKDAPTQPVPHQLAKADSESQPAATIPAMGKVHHVKAGETLAKIAANAGVSTEDIEEENGLKNVGALRVGQDIRIPAKAATKPGEIHKTTETKPPTETGSKHPRDSGEMYTVVKGENPVAIAKRLGVNYDELLKLNKIDDPKKLQIGQKLHVPVKAKSN
jgi:LysM repeat protein